MFKQLACLGLMIVFSVVSACQGLNTRIGWPSAYTAHGAGAFLVYVAVCALVAIAIAMMIATSRRQQGGPLFSTLALLAVVALLLQGLPPSDGGIQFIPLLPWAYYSWLSFLLSVLCWCVILLAGCVVLCGCIDAASVVSTLVLGAMAINVLLSFSEAGSQHAAPGVLPREVSDAVGVCLSFEEDCQQDITSWRQQASRLRNVLDRLVVDRNELADSMEKSGECGTGNRGVHQELAAEAAELDAQIEQVRREATALDSTIQISESRLRRIGRQEWLRGTPSISNKEYEQIFNTVRKLQETLRQRLLGPDAAQNSTGICQ